MNNYGSGEDENEVEEVEEFEAGSVEVQTSLQATDNTAEHSQVCACVCVFDFALRTLRDVLFCFHRGV